MNYGILSLIPILVCFLFIFISKNAFVSIISGIITAVVLIFIKEQNFVMIDSITDVFSSVSTVQTIVFILIVGAIIKATEYSNGVTGLITYLEKRKVNIDSPVLVQLFTMFIGILLFVDGTSSMVITSVVGKPLFSKAKISKEKLALVTNSTGSPIAWIIPFGGAGAFLSSIISQIDGMESNSFDYVLQAVPFQLYTILLLLLLILSIVFRFEIGPIKKIPFVESNVADTANAKNGKARNMVVPIVILLLGIAVLLSITGNGNPLKGDGATSVFYSGLLTLVLTLIYYRIQRICSIKECLIWYYKGIKSMFMVTLLLAIAMIFSDMLAKIGVASYMVGIFNVIPANFLPIMALALSAIVAFSTGTSGGTVAIVTGLVLPMAVLSGVSIPLVLGAIISGSVFGDQNSIISDSVILTSSVTGVNAVTHVKTQFPYTLIALGVSAVIFLILSFIL